MSDNSFKYNIHQFLLSMSILPCNYCISEAGLQQNSLEKYVFDSTAAIVNITDFGDGARNRRGILDTVLGMPMKQKFT
ncbi:hypothetical protein A0J61_04580 [Choanephora cucurbitarum]|uniref:Uncharacterized protein n=1 Tax=Choanephora cucurbitarum TaxID=101091 RepID=A0A1C7NEJ1_9FUNG|nr:hypothetical protein A0J61_04580 [Choanephora cucurbitarum]